MLTKILLALIFLVNLNTVKAADKVSFTCKSSLKWVTDLTKTVNCIAINKDFINEVKLYPKFTHTSSSPSQVAASLSVIPTYSLSTYKTKSPFSSVLATTYSTDKSTLYLNLRRNPRSMPDMVNTVFHESTHLLGYSHGDNSPKGKEESVPYKVGAIASKYYERCK